MDDSVFKSKTRDAIAKSVTNVLPNIKWTDLSRLIAELEIELKALRDLQVEETGEVE
jgi:hypothetical protein